MKISISKSILVVLLGFILHVTNGQFFKTHCSDHSQCASNQFLQCLNGYCQCDSRSQTYDYKLNQCAILVGKHCNFHNNFGPKCSRNSACILSKCECQPGYSINSEVSICKPNFQNQCNSPQDCEQDKGLTCFEGSCQCRNASLSYQGLFGCVDATDPNFIEMMTTLKRTESLLAENRIDLEEMLGDLDSAGSQSDVQIEARQLFEDSYSNTNTELLGSSQNQNAQGLGGILNLFRGLGNSLGGLRGITQLLQTLGGGANRPAQGGYPASGQGQGGQGGYAASGVPQNQQPQKGNNIFALFTTIMNLFNQVLPAVRQFKMLLNPLRIIQKLLRNFKNLIPNKNPTGGYGVPKAPAYGPPSNTNTQSQTPNYGPPSLLPAVTGGYNTAPATSPGPAPQVLASNSQPQAIDNNYQTLPVQSQSQQQATFQNFGTQSIQEHSFQAKPLVQQQSNFNSNQQGFQNNNQNQQGFQNNNQNQQGFQNNNYNNNNNNLNQNNQNNQQGFANQNQQFQNVPQSQNFQQQNPTIDNKRLPVVPSPTSGVSNNQYPRQERFASSSNSNDDDSPYLPEHL